VNKEPEGCGIKPDLMYDPGIWLEVLLKTSGNIVCLISKIETGHFLNVSWVLLF
jgi:hypothetical protein